MVKKTTTVTATVTTDSGNNAPAYDYNAEINGIVEDWKAGAKHDDKAEGAKGHAGFRLARILANDLLPQGGEYDTLRKHTPEAFFTSEEVRRVWKSAEVMLSFIPEKAQDDEYLAGKVRTNWGRTVELAFAVWACQRHYAGSPVGAQVDLNLCLIPAHAYVGGNDKWSMIEKTEDGTLKVVAFGTKRDVVLGKDKTKKPVQAVSLPFTPSISAFLDNKAAWLSVKEVRAKRDRANSKSNAKADPHGVPSLATVTATAAPELLTKAFTSLATDGKHTVLPAMAKDTKGKEGIGNMLYAILTNMAVNDADFLRGVIVDAVHDDNAGNALRSMFATVLNDAAKADAVRVSDELHDAIRDPFTATA